MKENRIVDERVMTQTMQIRANAYTYVSLFLLIAILIKQFVFKLEFEAYAVEFIAFFGSSFYILFKRISKGDSVYDPGGKIKPITYSLVNATVITITSILMRHKELSGFKEIALESIEAFVMSFITMMLLMIGVNKISKKRSDSLIEEFNDDEE